MSCYSTYLSPIHWYRFKGPAEVSASKSGKMSPIFIAIKIVEPATADVDKSGS